MPEPPGGISFISIAKNLVHRLQKFYPHLQEPDTDGALGHVRRRGPMDTSSAKQDEVDIGRDGADGVGGTEPRPRGFPPLTEQARRRKQQGQRQVGCGESGKGI